MNEISQTGTDQTGTDQTSTEYWYPVTRSALPQDHYDSMAEKIRRAFPQGRVVVTVEGVDAECTGHLADLLALALRTERRTSVRASASDFADVSGEVDYPYLHSALVEPFRAGKHFALVGFARDGNVLFDPQWSTAPDDSFLVLDGRGLDSAVGAS